MRGGQTQDALAFVGEGGLYLTDTSTVSKVSETGLDAFFENKRVHRGAVVFFKDSDILFSVGLSALDSVIITDVQFKLEGQTWVRWEVPFQQASSVYFNFATYIALCDGTAESQADRVE